MAGGVSFTALSELTGKKGQMDAMTCSSFVRSRGDVNRSKRNLESNLSSVLEMNEAD